MARLEQVLVNGEAVPLGAGLEGQIASSIGRNGDGSCVLLQIGIAQQSYSFAFPGGCAGSGGKTSGAPPPELINLNRIYRSALENLERNSSAIRRAVIGFIKSL